MKRNDFERTCKRHAALLFWVSLFILLGISDGISQFPEPKELTPARKFWQSIYTQYTTHQGVFHDRDNLSIIYGTITVTDPSSNRGKNKIKRTRRHYEALLKRLASGHMPQTDEERRIARQWGETVTRDQLRSASGNIRFQLGQKDRFRNGIQNALLHINEMQRILRKHGVPEDLAYIPLVESSFNTHAYSKFGAAGIWQFVRSSGKGLLTMNSIIDERLDITASTVAAAKKLKKNYDQLKTWPLAITAYNSGLARMRRAVRRTKTRRIATIINTYNEQRFGFASKNFYAEFLAARHIFKNRKTFFPDLATPKPFQYETLKTMHYVDIRTVSKYLGIPIHVIKAYNPSFRSTLFTSEKLLPPGTLMKFPPSGKKNYAHLYQKIPLSEKFRSQKANEWYRVKWGDNLISIAKRHKTTVRQLKTMNHLDSSRIYAGQLLKVAVADRYTPMLALRQHRSPQQTRSTGFVIVRPDETLGHIAEWLRTTPYQLRRLNRLSTSTPLRVGQRLKVSFHNVSSKCFTDIRNEYHAAIQEDFRDNYRVQRTFTYKISKGDNIWSLATHTFETPIWLLQQINPDKDVFALKAGQYIEVPVIIKRNKDS